MEKVNDQADYWKNDGVIIVSVERLRVHFHQLHFVFFFICNITATLPSLELYKVDDFNQGIQCFYVNLN